MKVKTKKQFTLPQLMEWAWENDVRNKNLLADNNVTPLRISIGGEFIFDNDYIYSKNHTFTIEVEEEITEDTRIPKLMTTFKKTILESDFGYQRVRIDENYKIKLMLKKAEAHRESVETLHIVNDDGTHTLIWSDGKLIE